MKKILSTFTLLALASSASHASSIPTFNSTLEKSFLGKKISVPYTHVISYIDFSTPGSEDAIVNGKKFSYIYVWIPVATSELGVRMVSPYNDNKKLDNPTVTKRYLENKESNDYFDTYVTIERSSITSLKGLKENDINKAKWTILDKNDDSRELPKQPSGSYYNSLLRYESNTAAPSKSLTKGLYRVGFTSFKKGEVKGSFLAQIGSPVKLPGVKITRNLQQLLDSE